MKNNKPILISVALVYKMPDPSFRLRGRGKPQWFIVRGSEDAPWEFPRTTVRRGESSVRAVIRQMGEQGGMRAKVLEEVGRSGGSTNINGKIVSQRYLYYLMICKGDSEVLGFTHFEWLEYEKVIKKLSSKKDISMLEKAKEMVKDIQKNKKEREDFEELEEEEIAIEEQG